jgi:aminoglycoside phosphotransferase (APT) family kinase protein
MDRGPDRLVSDKGTTFGCPDVVSARRARRDNAWAVPVGTDQVLRALDLLQGHAVATAPARVLPRSVVHFVGDSEEPEEGCKWVVKRSNPQAHQDDLQDPLDAAAEFAALIRLHGHFREVSASMSVPAPVDLLPDGHGFVERFVHGTQVNRLLHKAWPRRTEPLREVVTSCGRFLRHLHEIDERHEGTVVPARLAAEIQEFVAGPFASAGLTVPQGVLGALKAASSDPVPAVTATLHGDFAPVNFILRPTGRLVGIDLGLRSVSLVERDLARFIAMLSTDRPFMWPHAVPLERFRRSLIGALMDGYGDTGSDPVVLQLTLVDELLRRWTRRHTFCQGSNGRASAARYVLGKRFRSLLQEVCVPPLTSERTPFTAP